jgi:histidinol-phosphate aminotransferase
MAGARLAYAIGQRPIIEDMRKMKYSFNPYNVNRLTQVMGYAALCESVYYEEKCAEIIAARRYTEERLRKLGFWMTESVANFLLARHREFSAFELYSALREKGILVRHFDKPRISDFLRITIGTPEQMDKALAAIEAIFKEAANAKK